MSPLYLPGIFATPEALFQALEESIPWLTETPTRQECFMAPGPVPLSYTYGSGRGERTYTSIPMSPLVENLMSIANAELRNRGFGQMNVCFLNRYADERQHLGWHSDDHPGTDHARPIVSISFGGERDIWWRTSPPPRGPDWILTPTPEIPVERQLLESGSMFVMPPGMQQTHQHRIPKGSRRVSTRISLTLRAFLPQGT